MTEPVQTDPVQRSARGMPAWVRRRRARRLRLRACRYAEHGWPVAALAVPSAGRCRCPRGDCAEAHLLDGAELATPAEVEQVWGEQGWGVVVVTSRFDVLELPARYGARLHDLLGTACPTATAPRAGRWQFVLTAGSTDAEAVAAAGGVLHQGPHGWVPVSPTRTEATGRIGWIVEPAVTNWAPYRDVDPVKAVLAGWRA